MDDRSTRALDAWLASLSRDSRRELYILLDELVSGLDVSRHNRFGFLRLKAEFETSGEIFGCSLEQPPVAKIAEGRTARGALLGLSPRAWQRSEAER